MADIFLSYARGDWQRIKPLAELLDALGWSVWWDTRMRAGSHFDQMIEVEIEKARCVIVVWSQSSVPSHWVRAEAAEALDQHKLIPVFMDKVKVPLLFRHVQGLDLIGWEGSADDPRFERLVGDVSQLAGPAEGLPGKCKLEAEAAPERASPPSDAPRPSATPGSGASASGTTRDAGLPEPEMVRIEPGTFLMGSAEGEGGGEVERPQHEVRIAQPFAIGKYPVTCEQFDAFAKAVGQEPPRDRGWGRGRRPVIHIKWAEAVEYAQWLSAQTGKRYRLPTEAEWEYAARAGTKTPWSFGDDEGELGIYAWYSGNAGDQTHPVGEKGPNPWGLHDVYGNVWEWVQDCWHDSYERAPTDGSAWEEADGGDCGRRVLRGGSWLNEPVDLRSASRNGGNADGRLSDLGFRLAQDL